MQKIVYSTMEAMEFRIWKYWGTSSVAKATISLIISDLCMSAWLVLDSILNYLDCKIIWARNMSAFYTLSNLLYEHWLCSIFHDKLPSQCFYFWWLSQHFSCQLHRMFTRFSVDSLILNLWSCCSAKFPCFCPLRAIGHWVCFIISAYISQTSARSAFLPQSPT